MEQFGGLKQPESAIGTGPFLLERYEPSVKTVFTRHPAYFLKDQPDVDGMAGPQRPSMGLVVKSNPYQCPTATAIIHHGMPCSTALSRRIQS